MVEPTKSFILCGYTLALQVRLKWHTEQWASCPWCTGMDLFAFPGITVEWGRASSSSLFV